MNTFTKIFLGIFLLLVLHVVYTFVKYKQLAPDILKFQFVGLLVKLKLKKRPENMRN